MRPGDIDISIVVVTCNSGAVVERCLASIGPGVGALSAEVIVVDNASVDGTVELVASHPEVVRIRNSLNVGFAVACNRGMAVARGRHILLLNPDTIVASSALERLAAALEKHPDVGLAGPSLASPSDGRVRPSLGPVPSLVWLFSRLTPAKYLGKLWPRLRWTPLNEVPTTMGYLSGSCLLVRRAMLEQVGGLDEGYFLYWEDIEYSRRAIANGWKLLWTPAATVYHARAQSSANVDPGLRHWFTLAGARRYYEQPMGHISFMVVWRLFQVLHLADVLVTLFVSGMKVIVYAILGNRRRSQKHRQRWRDAATFLTRYGWRFVRL